LVFSSGYSELSGSLSWSIGWTSWDFSWRFGTGRRVGVLVGGTLFGILVGALVGFFVGTIIGSLIGALVWPRLALGVAVVGDFGIGVGFGCVGTTMTGLAVWKSEGGEGIPSIWRIGAEERGICRTFHRGSS
jgi:hypothetical protein